MRLLSATSNTTGNTFSMKDRDRYQKHLVQVDITGTATVVIQGRTYADMSWINIATYSANAADVIQVFPEMRAVSSGMSAGSVKVELDALKAI
jgi:hypothetical protein